MGTEQQVTLGSARREFARWRASKARHAEPVPDALWTQAVAVARIYGRSKTAKRLGLNHSALKRRVERSEASPAFVELPLAEVTGARASTESVVTRDAESTIELEDVAGTRLRIVLRGARVQEVALAARELWSARR